MSEREDLKKVCLICGCHTSEAINIYEPRNGPNIVELIQAKFKFQPINDKFLCFSCNNWLINWHSLQNLNKDPSTQSSKPRINDAIPEEEVEDASAGGGVGGLFLETNIQKRSPSKRNGFYFSKRYIGVTCRHKPKKLKRKTEECALCGKPKCTPKQPSKHRTSFKCCKSCKMILRRWKAKYSESLLEEERRKLKQTKTSHEFFFKSNIATRLRQWNRPLVKLVDGKVVAMLRRQGTTLTRENVDCSSEPKPIPQKNTIASDQSMSNEILIDFNTAITEVLPFDSSEYHILGVDDKQDDKQNTVHMSLEAIYSKIPKCVTVSIVTPAIERQ